MGDDGILHRHRARGTLYNAAMCLLALGCAAFAGKPVKAGEIQSSNHDVE
jgi:hypothetical protein